MLARENHVFGCTRSKASQGSVPAGLTLASDISFCFQCQAGSSLVLRRPIEITALTGQRDLAPRAAPTIRILPITPISERAIRNRKAVK
jgi:hypothetical protein